MILVIGVIITLGISVNELKISLPNQKQYVIPLMLLFSSHNWYATVFFTFFTIEILLRQLYTSTVALRFLSIDILFTQLVKTSHNFI